ncbi:hypothetical protein HOD83_03530 [Candidatus Woesearchaeota archaeon]|jgi:hypothetical protein|nr:hypothetical protein [Candidatus Woesearchaeota archaeon]MBT4114337.1 hypothetical protein [Candidatus Woesearchaeota archaeon]MBT4248626.1 hypothetical protein [Candidatus Woesearchaeota archaeon]
MKIRSALLGIVIVLLVASIVGALPSADIVGFFGFEAGGMSFDPSGPPSMTADEQCVQDCVDRDCAMFNKESGSTDMTPAEMQANMAKYEACMLSRQTDCDAECDMVKAPALEDMDEEQKCITECVSTHDPEAICGSSKEGETGNDVCQMCAQQCVHLYDGPCLNDEQITAKEDVCYAQCAHCYGEPIEGPSGEGWDCIVDIQCADASAEFGDDPGSGPDSYEPGHEPSEDNVVFDQDSASESPAFVAAIAEFFNGLFN